MQPVFRTWADIVVYVCAVIFVAVCALTINQPKAIFGVNTMNTESNNATALPKGFEPVLSPMDFPKYEFKLNEAVIARVVDVQSHDFGTIDKPKKTAIMLIDIGGTTYALYESAGLRELMKAATPGSLVRIEYIGEEKIPGKPSPMKRYRTSIKRA